MKKFLLALGLLALLSTASRSSAMAFTSAGPISLAGAAADRRASPYPSAVIVSGVPAGSITSVKVTLNNLTVPRPDDLEILLVAPWGAQLVILADAGGAGTAVAGINVTLDDAAASLVPDAGPLGSGSFKPTCVDNLGNIATEFPGLTVADPGDTAAPSGSATFTSVFGGSNNPNGTWNLYVVDDVSSDPGGTIGSWTLDITTSPTTVATTTTLGASPNPSLTGQAVTFTATVIRQSDAAVVTSGTVTFKEGVSILAANVAINGSGQAALATAALSEGSHTITAEYSPGTGFLASNGSVGQRVDNATVQTGNTFANPGALTLAASVSGTANVYPSHVFVTGLSGTLSKVTFTLDGLTIDRPDDLELLLVGPNGASFIVLGDAGGTAAGVAGVSLTFDDAAASLIPDATAPASGTYRPTSYSSSALPGPAPAGPYNHPAPQGSSTFAGIFGGMVPNGTWSLYAFDDVTGEGASISGGWALTFTTSDDAPTTTTVTSAPNPSATGASATFTATVRQADNTPVTAGFVTFREGATALAGPIALDGSGEASFATSAFAEGSHTVSADYGGSPGDFNLSTGSTVHTVQNPTVVTGNSFCNTGTLTLPATLPSLASVYPSAIHVSGLTGPLTTVTLALTGISIDRPDDLEVLLVSPSGGAFLVLGDAGGTGVPASGVDLVLADAAGSLVPPDGPLTSGTFLPTSVNSSPASFPAPAPAAFVQAAPAGAATFASVFNGIDPNGTWLLYVLDDVGGGGGVIAGGWCLTVDTDAVPVTGSDQIFRDQDRSVKVPIAQLLANDTDSDGTAPTFVSVASTSANGAAVHVVGSWIEYEAVPGNNADDSFTYTVTDGTSEAEGTVLVTVKRPEGATLNLALTPQGPDQLVQVTGIPGRTYQVQTTDSLVLPIIWSDLGAPVIADAVGRGSVPDAAPPSPRFYRAIEP